MDDPETHAYKLLPCAMTTLYYKIMYKNTINALKSRDNFKALEDDYIKRIHHFAITVADSDNAKNEILGHIYKFFLEANHAKVMLMTVQKFKIYLVQLFVPPTSFDKMQSKHIVKILNHIIMELVTISTRVFSELNVVEHIIRQNHTNDKPFISLLTNKIYSMLMLFKETLYSSFTNKTSNKSKEEQVLQDYIEKVTTLTAENESLHEKLFKYKTRCKQLEAAIAAGGGKIIIPTQPMQQAQTVMVNPVNTNEDIESGDSDDSDDSGSSGSSDDSDDSDASSTGS